MNETGELAGPYKLEEISTVISYKTAFPFIITFSTIASIIATVNLIWIVRHTIRIKRMNIFNIGLCISNLAFLVHSLSFVFSQSEMYNLNYPEINDENLEKLKDMNKWFVPVNRLSWAFASIVYIILVQSRFCIIGKSSAKKAILSKLSIVLSVVLWVPFGLLASSYVIRFCFFNDIVNCKS